MEQSSLGTHVLNDTAGVFDAPLTSLFDVFTQNVGRNISYQESVAGSCLLNCLHFRCFVLVIIVVLHVDIATILAVSDYYLLNILNQYLLDRLQDLPLFLIHHQDIAGNMRGLNLAVGDQLQLFAAGIPGESDQAAADVIK